MHYDLCTKERFFVPFLCDLNAETFYLLRHVIFYSLHTKNNFS